MTELKQLFDGLAEQARVYDVVERAKHRGRHRRYRRRAAVAGGAMLSVTSVLIGLSVIPQAAPVLAPSPSATTEETPTPRPEQVIACQADELALPSGYPRKVFVTGGDPTGRYVLGRLYPDGARDRLAIWDGGQPRTVAMQGADDTFHDITTTGVAVGSSFIGEDEASWIFQNGKLTRLPGNNVKAVAINENLVIAGLIGSMPASWRTPASAPEPLPLPPGEWLLGDVRGIDDRGYIVGSMITKEGNKGGATKGLLWHPDGTVEILPNPAEYPDPESVWPTGIRGDWVAGRLMARGGRLVNVRWNLRTGETTSYAGVPMTETVNALGWTAGLSKPALSLPSGAVVVLPTNLEGYQGMAERDGVFRADGDVSVISDDGKHVAGTLHDKVLGGIGVRWTCG